MRKLPPLRALHAFEAAARHHSFAAAASELGVTPTAISHQIRQLEEACGVKLFQRRPRPLLLTRAGAKLYPSLRDGFDALASAVASLAEEDAQAPLRVTSPSAFASKWLVPQLPKWRAANPRVPLEIIGTDAVLDIRAGAAVQTRIHGNDTEQALDKAVRFIEQLVNKQHRPQLHGSTRHQTSCAAPGSDNPIT